MITPKINMKILDESEEEFRFGSDEFALNISLVNDAVKSETKNLTHIICRYFICRFVLKLPPTFCIAEVREIELLKHGLLKLLIASKVQVR